MNKYIATLKADYKTNEVAQVLALVAVAFTVVFGGLLAIAAVNGGALDGAANALTFPMIFWTLAVAHFLVRPAVLLHYATN